MLQYILIFISEPKEYLIRNLSGENTSLHHLIPSKVLHPIFDTTLDILNEQTQYPLLIADVSYLLRESGNPIGKVWSSCSGVPRTPVGIHWWWRPKCHLNSSCPGPCSCHTQERDFRDSEFPPRFRIRTPGLWFGGIKCKKRCEHPLFHPE